MLSQIVRGTASTSRMRAVDGGGESRGGTHTAAGAGTRRARAPTGGGMGISLLPDNGADPRCKFCWGSIVQSKSGWGPQRDPRVSVFERDKFDTRRREVRLSAKKRRGPMVGRMYLNSQSVGFVRK